MNAATIRSVQRYTSEANRDTLNPVPETGQPAYIEDIDEFQVYDGTAWHGHLHLKGGTITGVLILDDELNLLNPGDIAASANTSPMLIGNSGRVYRSLTDYLELTGGTLTGDLKLPSHTVSSKDAKFGTGQQILLLEDGSAVFDNGMRVSDVLIQNANTSALRFNRQTAPVQWRFVMSIEGNMLIQSSLDGTDWQTEDTWTRT